MRIACLLLAVACVHGALPTWPKFFLMMFENHGYDEITTDVNWMPWIAGSFLLTDYYAVTHPSSQITFRSLVAITLHALLIPIAI